MPKRKYRLIALSALFFLLFYLYMPRTLSTLSPFNHDPGGYDSLAAYDFSVPVGCKVPVATTEDPAQIAAFWERLGSLRARRVYLAGSTYGIRTNCSYLFRLQGSENRHLTIRTDPKQGRGDQPLYLTVSGSASTSTRTYRVLTPISNFSFLVQDLIWQ